MDALILAAGEGTRLLPLTRTKPKPLFPILNRPLLKYTFDYLNRFAIKRVILNTHHLASQLEDFVRTEQGGRPFEIQTRFEPMILGTGGGIGNTRDFWSSDPFLVMNGDILTDIDLHQALNFHQSHKGPVTLILHDYPEFNRISVDAQGRIQDFRLESGRGLAFTGIHLLGKEVFDFLPRSGAYDIIPVYQRMIQEGTPVRAYISQSHYWRDMGTPKSYLKVHGELLCPQTPPLPPANSTSPPFIKAASTSLPPFDKGRLGGILIHPEARIEKDVAFSGWACIGKGCLLKSGCRIQNSVLWEEVKVESGVSVLESIVGDKVHVGRSLSWEVAV
jgi:NDP-sugar pyrophosphorylase family protein